MKTIIRSLIIALISLCSSGGLAAQDYQITGQVLDSLTLEGEPMATLRIWKAGTREAIVLAAQEPATQDLDNKTAAALGTTDAEGRFTLALTQPGDYFLLVTSIGRTPLVRHIGLSSASKVLNLGKLLIAESAKSLKDVVVATQRPIVSMEADKVGYSVKDDPDAKGRTVIDMLRKVPMVTVDGQDNITVNGSGSFQIFLNGKPSPMLSSNPGTTLKAMPAEGIRKIEVLTNPGAKYDAEGVGGILNIVTEQQQGMEGYSGNVHLMSGNRANGGGVYAMIQHDKLTLSVNANENYISMPDVTMTNENHQTAGDRHTMYEATNGGHTNSTFGNIDASYAFDERNSLEANVSVMNMTNRSHADAVTDITGNGLILSHYTQTNLNRTYNTSVNGSIDFTHTFEGNPTHTLTAAYRLGTQPRRTVSASDYSLDYMPDYDQTNRNNMLEHTLQIDYVRPLNDIHSMEMGGKYVWRQSSSRSDEFDYEHTSQIAAAYATYGLKTGSYSLKAGLRYEHTAQEVNYSAGNGEDFDVTYDNLVPNITLGLSPHQGQNLSLAYNMRISRPGITLLNPFRNTQDRTTVSYGNPQLDVEKVHNTQLTYNYYSMKFMLNATARYSYQDNGIERYTFVNDGVIHSTYDNIARRQNASLSIFLSWTVSPATRLTLNNTTTYADLRASRIGERNSGWQESLMASLQQNIWWGMKLSLMYMPSTPAVSLQGSSSAFSMHMAGLSKTMLDDRLSVNVNVINPFKSSMEIKNDQRGDDFTSHSCSKIGMRSCMVSVSYRFGNLKQRQQPSRSNNYESDVRDVEDQNQQMNQMFVNQ